jgi:hypothetical protein
MRQARNFGTKIKRACKGLFRISSFAEITADTQDVADPGFAVFQILKIANPRILLSLRYGNCERLSLVI